jgi:hypothetical protein
MPEVLITQQQMHIAEKANSTGLYGHRAERKHHAIHRNRQQTKPVMQLPDDRNNVVQLLLHSLQLHHYVVNPRPPLLFPAAFVAAVLVAERG